MLAAALPALAQTCAPPSSLVTGPTSGIVNDYYPGGGTLAVGATSLTLGTRDSRGGPNSTIIVGDLLLVMQMQDASINTSNNSTYGDGSGSGTGSTSVGRSGLFEFVRATSVAGANIGFTPPLTNSYAHNATAGTLQKRYQVVRVMQYSSLAATGITALAWNGATGGIAVVDVRDTLTLTGGTVEGEVNRAFFVAGKGFRGGAGRQGTAAGNINDWVTQPASSTVTAIANGTKAEGIAGMPQSISNYIGTWGYRNSNPPAAGDLTVLEVTTGYPGGSFARGAPANGGGGGTEGSTTANTENAGGGGGGNYGPGGIGGRPWNKPLEDSGGRGGAGYAGTLAFNRAFLGGGGGSGGTNNGTSDNNVYDNQARACNLGTVGLCSAGASGGGIVIIRARSIGGAGVIDARGAHGYAVQQDAGGGGGAGGSVVVQTSLGGNASIDVRGGDGGNAWAGNAVTVVAGSQTNALAARHGPGGGGGGGFIAYAPNSTSIAAQVDGGEPGRTIATLPGEHYGSSGYNGGLTTFQSPNVPGVVPAAQCDPSLSLAKTNGTTSLSSPGTTTYSFTVLNSGNGFTVGTVTVADQLPAGLSVPVGPLPLSGANAASWSCQASTTTAILCTSVSTISGGASTTFAFAAAVSAANGSSLVNRARVSGGGDPTKTTPADPVTQAAACTANDTPAGCALDSDTVVAPSLSLTKTNGTDTVTRGGTTTFSLVVTNAGGTATTGTIRLIDVLPTGMTYAGTTTASGFVCTNAAPNVTCDRTTALAAGASATVSLVVTIDANAPSSLTNLARVGGGGDPSAAKSVPVAASVTACASPVPPATTASDANNGCAADTDEVRYVSLTLAKDDGAPFMSQNGSLVYLFTVHNNGTAPSTGTISVRDVLPTPMSFSTPGFTVGGANAADWSCTRVSATTATCNSTVAIPAGGDSFFSLPVSVGSVTVTAPNNQYTNKARVAGGGDVSAGMLSSIPSDASVTVCIATGDPAGCAIDMNTAQNAARIRLAKSHANPQARSPGDTVTFTLTVSNSGGATAAADTVRVIDVLPTGMGLVSVTPSAGMACTATAPVIQCRNSNALAAGASNTVAVVATVSFTATNPLVNRAKASGGGDPQNTGPLTTATASITTVSACVGTDAPNYGCATDDVPLNADLQITKSQRTGTGTFGVTTTVVPVNGTVQFQIDVTNNGPSQVTGALIADTVPTNFSTVTWTCTVQNAGTGTGTTACGTASGTGNAISFASGLMKSGAVLRIVVNATALTATDFDGVINTATVGTPTGIVDGTPTNNIGTVTTRIGSVNLGITKTNGVSTVVSGTTTTYTITVGNSGTFPADGARLYDPAVTGLSCTTPPTCVASGAGTTCPASITVAQIQNGTVPTGVAIPTFGPGGLLTLSYTCSVTATGQ